MEPLTEGVEVIHVEKKVSKWTGKLLCLQKETRVGETISKDGGQIMERKTAEEE